jgi:hypothetical protein
MNQKVDKIAPFNIAVPYIVFFILGQILLRSYENNLIITSIGQYIIGLDNIYFGVVAIILGKKQSIIIAIYFIILGIGQIVVTTYHLFY